MRFGKSDKNQGFDDQDFCRAVEICLNHFSYLSENVETWRKLAWTDVVGVFGEVKATLIFQRIYELEKAFFSIKPRHSVGSSVVHDAKTVRKGFQATYPSTPPLLIKKFEHRYLWGNR